MFGRRPDATEVTGLSTMRRFMPYVSPRRNDSLFYMVQEIEVEAALEFLEKKNQHRPPDRPITLFHLFLRSCSQALYLRPGVNRFVKGGKLWQRKDELLSFSALKEIRDGSLMLMIKRRFHPTIIHVSISLWLIAVFFLVFFPNIAPTIATAKRARFAPSDAWMSSLFWLKENTPEPFNNPDFYYELHKLPFQYPESAYGVMAWWDYGYWITRIAHRIPVVNPSQQAEMQNKVGNFFTSQDEDSANEIVQELGSSYIIIDFDTATGKFWAIVLWAGKEGAEFFDVYLKPQENNRYRAVQLFHPEYYRALASRLYIFDGKAVTPDSSTVIFYELKSDKEGTLYKVINSEKQFDSYEEAEAYLSSQESGNYQIVGNDPFVSPVPLEALKHHRLAYSSSGTSGTPGGGRVPSVKIFEYVD